MKLLLIFTGVGRIQDPFTAGVRKAIINVYKILQKRGHQIKILVPEGSESPTFETDMLPVAGTLEKHLPDTDPNVYPIFKNTFLANALRYAKINESEYDFIINLSNDWLPYYMTPFFKTPLLHRMNLAHENEVTSEIIRQTAKAFPLQIGILTKAQASDVGIEENTFWLGQGLDIEKYPFFNNKREERKLAFIGRISPEKGLEDAAEIARRTDHQLMVFGHLQNTAYFEKIMQKYGDTIQYKGYADHNEMTKGLANCKALISTHKWIDAFPSVIIQAMTCGLPVISYERGGPKEIIQNGKTGFLIPPDNIEAAVDAIDKLPTIDSHNCKQYVKENFSLEKLGYRYEAWFRKVKKERSKNG